MAWKVNLEIRTVINDFGLMFEIAEEKKDPEIYGMGFQCRTADGKSWFGACTNADLLNDKIVSGELDANGGARLAREAADSFVEKYNKKL